MQFPNTTLCVVLYFLGFDFVNISLYTTNLLAPELWGSDPMQYADVWSSGFVFIQSANVHYAVFDGRILAQGLALCGMTNSKLVVEEFVVFGAALSGK